MNKENKADQELLNDFEARERLKRVIEALEGLSHEDQLRVLTTAAAFYGLD